MPFKLPSLSDFMAGDADATRCAFAGRRMRETLGLDLASMVDLTREDKGWINVLDGRSVTKVRRTGPQPLCTECWCYGSSRIRSIGHWRCAILSASGLRRYTCA
jgi:hypothetical protein